MPLRKAWKWHIIRKMKEFRTLLIASAAAFALLALGAYFLIYGSPASQKDLSPVERSGRMPEEAVSTTSASSVLGFSSVRKMFSDEVRGLSFMYPEDLHVSERRSGDDREIELRRGERDIPIRLTLGCVREPNKVSDRTWEADFTEPNYGSAVDFDLGVGSMIREYSKGGVALFVHRLGCHECGGSDAADNQGFGAIACASGANLSEELTGKCLRIYSSLYNPNTDEYYEFQHYFLNDFIPSIQLSDTFQQMRECPGYVAA